MNGKPQILVSLLCLSILLVCPIKSYGKDFALSCGASEATADPDKKQWEPDTEFLKTENSVEATATYQDPSLLSTIPYMKARIFQSPANYEIPIKGDKRHLIRLHFYPSTYSGFNISNSYFGVAANDVTLLSNFSAAITCQALTQAYLIREYSLAPTAKDVLTITFTPSDKHRDAFAFINGIEVIQMPEMFDSAVLVGFADQTADTKTANLQSMFRLNVGGQDIPGSQDSGGLTRTWYNDAPYIFSAGLGVTKDYAIYVDKSAGGDEIVLQMTPSNVAKPEYLDSQLNGLEIFKIDTMKNLAGPNPEPSPMQASGKVEKEFRNDTRTAVIIGTSGGAAALLICALCFTVYQKQRRYPGSDSNTSSWLPIYGNSHTTGTKSTISGKSTNGSHLSNLAAGLCRRFTWTEIKQGTKNFDESNVIGIGGFGKVYKGIIDGNTKVAIKRSNPNSEQGLNEFETEIELLSRLRHKHLVSLIGYCDDGGEMCLVYDYMALGTLREHLYNTKKPQLTWKRRLEIAIGAARGLHYR